MKDKNMAKSILKDTTESLQNTKETSGKDQRNQEKIYYSFFEYAPIALWIEDFSKAKKHIDQLLEKEDSDIKTLIQKHPTLIRELTSLVTIKDVNRAAVQLYKAKDKSELLGNLDKILTEKSNEAFAKLVVDIFLGEKESEVESKNKTLKGEEFDISLKLKVGDDNESSFENVILAIENISDKVRSRNELAESEGKYRQAQSLAKLGTWYYDFYTDELYWSDEIFELIGYESQKQQLNLDFYLSIIHEDDVELVNNFSIEYLLSNPTQQFKYRVRTIHDEWKYVFEKRICKIVDNRIVKVIGICQDITENVLSEQKLNSTKNLLSNTLSEINDGLVILDSKSNYMYVNERAAELLGKNSDKLMGKHIWTEFPEKDGDLFYDNYQKAIRENKPISFENYFEPWNRWFENRIVPSSEGVLIFFQEITERKIRENKIKEAYNIINKSSSVAILCKNETDYPVVFASENTEELFGYSYVEFISNKLKIHQVVHHEDLKAITTGILAFKASDSLKSFKPKPFRIVTKNNEIKWIQASIDVIKNDQNEITHIQGIVEDITERKKTEDLFFKSNQRLKDQFNNTPLASIMWDLDFKVMEWNNSAQRIFGYTAEEAIGRTADELIVPESIREDIIKVKESLLAQKGGYRNTNENSTKDGNIITCDWYNVVLKDAEGNLIGMASLVDDITEGINSKRLLEKSERKYRDIFEKSIDAVFILRDEKIVDCNLAAQRMFGYANKKSILRIHPSEISPDVQPNGEISLMLVSEKINYAIEKGSNRFVWYHKKRNGHVFPAEVTLTRIDDHDHVSSIHAVVRDISEKVKKETIEEVFYNISKAALTISDFKEFSSLVKGELHKIIDTSNFYIALYDEKKDRIQIPFLEDERDNFKEFPTGETLSGHVIKTKESKLVTNKSIKEMVEKGYVKPVGTAAKIWMGVPLKINEKVFGVMVVQSYTDEHAYNENDVLLMEFVANQISLTIERKKAESDLKKALIKAQESDRLKSAFLANMSHEIRTPMNGIIGFSELFLNPDLSEKNRNEYAKIIINSSKRLLAIVNDILDISKIEAGVVKLDYENVNINKLIDDLYAFYQPIARERKLILKCNKGLENNKCVIEIDKNKLNQVLTNLLSNSFKFTDKGSVEFGYDLVENELQFYVKDTGIGIDKKLENKIFDQFVRENLNLDKRHKGTGLGLSISKKFIELFKGKIWVSPSDEGTTINFTIPYERSNVSSVGTVFDEQKSVMDIKKEEITILIAEDEEYNMLYMNEIFSNTRFHIIEAENGLKAVELARDRPDLDLILMDIKMPVMNGYEAMEEIKKFRPDLPVIALTAFAMESDRTMAINTGFDSYLTKPIDRKKLFKLINQFTN